MSLRLLRAEVWRNDHAHHARSLRRVTARTVPDHLLDTPVVVAHARLVVIGGDSHRLHEELVEAGGEIREGRFRRLGVTKVQELLAAASEGAISAEMQARLQGVWPGIEDSLRAALTVRMSERAESLGRQLAQRAEKEAADITAVLQELERTILAELQEPEYVQLDLFSESERDQYSRNVAALRARLAQIPDEIAHETAAVRQRYADPQPRLFPVAVTFLIPWKLK